MRITRLATAAILILGCGDSESPPVGGSAEGGAGPVGGGGAASCNPGETVACFSGTDEQRGVGLCQDGTKTCNDDGTFGPCDGEVVATTETCANVADEDCDGLANEEGPDCNCDPGDTQACYSAAPSTQGVGPCKAGTQDCNADGDGWGPCNGEVTPEAETCATSIDDDCDGQVNEGGTGCVCTPNANVACYTGPSGTNNVGVCHGGTAICNASGTQLGPCNGDLTPSLEACLGATDTDCDGDVGELTGCSCAPGDVITCYSGPANTNGVGPCHGGQRTCQNDGMGYGSCVGEVTPGTESCATAGDEDCDGTPDDGCTCAPGTVESCYTGPNGTLNVGTCHAGSRTCDASGLSWGMCMGQVVPVTEQCGSASDVDCDGVANESFWSETTVDVHTPGDHSSLVVDAAGGVHALYHDTSFDDVNYAYKPFGGSFTETTVDSHTPDGYMQLRVDASGGVHALYHDATFDDLDYAYKPAGGSFTETTVETHTPGPDSKLVVDAAGGVHVLYHDTMFNDLVYAYKPAGGSFTKTTVDVNTPGPHPQLVVDAAGGVHVLYHDTMFNDLDYAYKPAGGSFTQTTVDVNTPGAFPKLAVDAAGGVHVLYQDTFFNDLDYAYKPAGGAFTQTTVDVNPPGAEPSLVVDTAGGVHALWVDTMFNDLDYAYKPAGGSFTPTTVDSNAPGPSPKLFVDASGGVHALYHDTFFDDLDYAYKPAGGSFTEMTVDVHAPAEDPRLAVDAAGGVHALYHDTSFDDLDYAYLCP